MDAKKWRVCYLVNGKVSCCEIVAQKYCTFGTSVFVAEFVNNDPEFEKVATFFNVVSVTREKE